MSSELTSLAISLEKDLHREYAHWHFYVHAAAIVSSLHREEYSEMFTKEATSEMQHILDFSKLILGLGTVPNVAVAILPGSETDPYKLIKTALDLEEEVVKEFLIRMEEAAAIANNTALGLADRAMARRVELFLEDQMLDSHDSIDNFKQMLN